MEEYYVLYGAKKGESFHDTKCLDISYRKNGEQLANLAIQPGSVSFSVLDYSYGTHDLERTKVLNLLKKNGFASIFEPDVFSNATTGLSITDIEQVNQILIRAKNFLRGQKQVEYHPLIPTYEYELENQLGKRSRRSR